MHVEKIRPTVDWLYALMYQYGDEPVGLDGQELPVKKICNEAIKTIFSGIHWYTRCERPTVDGFYFIIAEERALYDWSYNAVVRYHTVPIVAKWNKKSGWLLEENIIVQYWMPIPNWNYKIKDGMDG